MPSVGLVIIGNEILTGKFRDENGPYLIDRLRSLGADLCRIAVVQDSPDVIAREVRTASDAYDFVVTSGGVGPTHDDVTLESVARAFGVEVEEREELVELMDRYRIVKNEETLRMARVPEGTSLIWSEAVGYPVVRCNNVFVLPGVPKLFRAKFEVIADQFRGSEVFTARVYTDERETAIAERLTRIDQETPGVDIGSYPRFGEGNYKVIITLESRDPTALEEARSRVAAALATVEPA